MSFIFKAFWFMRFRIFYRPSRWAWVHFAVTLLVSFIAGGIAVIQTTTQKMYDLLQHGYYYYSLVLSSAIALALIWYVYAVTCWLNRRDDGFKPVKKRLLDQFIYGLLFGAVLELILSGFAYWINGRSIFGGSYFYHLFIMVVLFLLAANLLYCFYFVYTAYHFSPGSPETPEIPELPAPTKMKYKVLRNKSLELPDAEVAVAYYIFCVEGLKFAAFTSARVWETWVINLTETMKMMPEGEYFRVNKQVLIHWRNIECLKQKGKNLYVVPFYAYQEEILVSRRNKAAIKRWYYTHREQYIKEMEAVKNAGSEPAKDDG